VWGTLCLHDPIPLSSEAAGPVVPELVEGPRSLSLSKGLVPNPDPRSLSLSKGLVPNPDPRSLSLSKGLVPNPDPRSLSLSKGAHHLRVSTPLYAEKAQPRGEHPA
jgi:hypothetical protein